MYLTFACMLATWVWLIMVKFIPLYGHFAWIAGALLIRLPQWMGDRKPDAAKGPVPR